MASACLCLQCESMPAVERRLKEMGIQYIKRCVEEGGIYVDQIFFHDPDGFMIEICNCDNLPVIPLGDHTAFAMASCKRAVVKQTLPVPVQTAPPATVATAAATAAAQCVPSANKAMPRVAGEEAATAHISCA